jgi:hypothetical protein
VTAPVVIVEFGDPEGGWVPRGGRSTAPVAFLQVADGMTMQPPQALLQFPDRALWSLRKLDVTGFGEHWCFTSQSIGRAGRLRAGGCDFVFGSTESWDPGPFWWHCIRSAGWAGPRTPTAAPQVEDALNRLLAGFPFIPVEGHPEGVAQVIGHLLDMLPAQEAMARTWWTCVLRPALAGKAAVIGTWPSDFPEQDARLVNRLIEAPPKPTGEKPVDRQADAVRRLAQLATESNGRQQQRPHP